MYPSTFANGALFTLPSDRGVARVREKDASPRNDRWGGRLEIKHTVSRVSDGVRHVMWRVMYNVTHTDGDGDAY